MSLREDVWRYEQITGESAEHVPIIKLGAFLDGYDMAIKALKTQDRLTQMLNKRITAYAEAEKSKDLNDLEYGRKTAYAHCLEVLNDD